MFESKYSKVLTVVLVIVIIAIVALLGFLSYDFIKKYNTSKQASDFVEEYQGNLLLVGINYNKKTKEHECVIEKYEKNQ